MNRRNNKKSNKYNAKFDKKIDGKDTTKRKGDNDSGWYTRNQALIADSGRIAFTWPTGIPVDLDIQNTADVTINGRSGDKLLMPGVMSLKYVPTFGLDHGGYDPLNIAAQNVYTYVRHVQSGHSNYDAPDLMLYLMAMDQIYTLYMHLVRAYGTIRLFSQKNRNFPRVIMNAMGFDYDDVAANLADFRYYINNAATRIGAMCVPNNMPIFARHMWMPSAIFADGPSAKAQLYIFRPIVFGVYNEKTSSDGGFLDSNFMDYKHTVKEWCQQLDTMIAAVRSSEDCGIISGDILKAYGDNVIKLPSISEDYTTLVTYSEEVLGQIANATVMPEASYPFITVGGNQFAPIVYQDINNNVLKSNVEFSTGIAASTNPLEAQMIYKSKRVMAGLSEQPSNEEVMVNSRLMVVAKEITAPSATRCLITADSVGSEVVVEAAMYDTDNMEGYHNASPHKMALTQYLHYYNGAQAMGYQVAYTAIAKANYFNMHPCFNFGVWASGTPGTINYSQHFDVDNYAIVDAHDIAKMHDTALLSMLDVPLLGAKK